MFRVRGQRGVGRVFPFPVVTLPAFVPVLRDGIQLEGIGFGGMRHFALIAFRNRDQPVGGVFPESVRSVWPESFPEVRGSHERLQFHFFLGVLNLIMHVHVLDVFQRFVEGIVQNPPVLLVSNEEIFLSKITKFLPGNVERRRVDRFVREFFPFRYVCYPVEDVAGGPVFGVFVFPFFRV